ncbi:hypothetical protein SAY87_023678 [Trapa incisa]|uniref:Uncharacterized protein n=1 Tax=Trapa incisa TaxID=236973 RepID=A0AAN7L748_9MYRT|nr:hypothetical protein SAY87_023678 [Trapa incisa]
MTEQKSISTLLYPKQSSLRLALAQWRLRALTTLFLLGLLVFWSIDGNTVRGFIDAWRPSHEFSSIQVLAPADLVVLRPNPTLIKPHNATHTPNNFSSSAVNPMPDFSVRDYHLQNRSFSHPQNRSFPELSWFSTQLEPNYTSSLLAKWLTPGGSPCRESKTEQIALPGLDGPNLLELSAGSVHEFPFTALDSSGTPRCLGGDYYETDLSGESWKSRPPVKDFGNGTYSISLQVHPDFEGDYNLTIILLFRHFEGLKFSPPRFVVDRNLRSIRIRFRRSQARLPELQLCESTDFSRDVWVGRWTRHGKNENCSISNDGRYRCLAADFPCRMPWCNGSLGALESNGWVYSAHCSFRLFPSDVAWNCLKNRWIFFWGDSNHVDTIRNILNFILGRPEIRAVPRRFDMNFTNPHDPSQSVRITSIFNGHSNETKNYEGLDSLKNEAFRDLLRKYFSEDRVPDTMIMNSGLHDGIHWPSIRAFVSGAEYAASFWAEVMDSVRRRGLRPPKIFYRTTVATAGQARSQGFNPSKMEAFNGVTLDQFRKAGLISGIIDNFDLTFPWHFNNRCSDGVHYGRAPLKKLWWDGEIGHQYFVDLMLSHILLNALCSR